MGNWINFAELRARVSLEDVILKFYRIDSLKRDGNKLVGPCPVHNGDSPRAFSADLSRSVWMCFTKNHGGNQLDFVAQRENISIRDAALKLQEFFFGSNPPSFASAGTARIADSVTPTKHDPPVAKDEGDEKEINPPLTLKLDLKPDHPHLLTERQLKPETIARFGVGYCSRGLMRGAIAIPIHDEEGELVAYAGRRLKFAEIQEHGKYKFPSGFTKDAVLYNLHRAQEHLATDGIILVEGFFSVMKLYEMGFPNVVATMGCGFSQRQAKLLADAKEVICLYDGNSAGAQGAVAARERLAAQDTIVRTIHLPTTGKPNGYEPEDLSPRMLRWLVNGLRQLDLAEVSFTFPPEPVPTTTTP
jgi:DNA primase